MKVVYAREPFPDSFSRAIFLAGPTPRSKDVESWRPEAIRILKEIGFDGAVFVPEDNSAAPKFDYMHQVDWEEKGLHKSDVIVFWVPRELETMPAFTTNVEWGVWCNSGKVVLGSPPNAPKMAYLKHYAEQHAVPISETLESTLENAIQMIGEGESRQGGECDVPIWMWRSPPFQQWYQSQIAAGNRLDGARVFWQYQSRYSTKPFCWILKPRIYVTKEDRYKSGELVITRPDICSVIAYHRGATLHDSSVVLVREFRSNAATSDGMVHELPGGSSPDELNPTEVAANELQEETGVHFPSERFTEHESRQCFATMITHRGKLFSIELSDEELQVFRGHEGKCFGESDSERTYVEVRSVSEILNSSDVDWTHVGMILSVLNRVF